MTIYIEIPLDSCFLLFFLPDKPVILWEHLGGSMIYKPNLIERTSSFA